MVNKTLNTLSSSDQSLFLARPAKTFEEKIIEYKQEHFVNGDRHIHGSCGLAYYEDFDAWLNLVLSIENRTFRNGVHTSTFFTKRIEDDKIIGCIKLHHSLTKELKNGGHIAYGIRPSERNKGYGKQQLQLMLDFACNLGMHEVVITCDKNNIPSAMTAKSCGGILIKEFNENDMIKQQYIINTTFNL